ncbi:MAG TPA: threonine--tRNA ligase [archaeon]|nr:threonine--tRNA ligase [archaeon]
MKILLIHSDFLEFEPKEKAIKSAEEKGEKKRFEECLVVFTAVESGDEKNIKQAAEKLAEEVKKVADDVKAKNIILYPYAHLSKELASPDAAKKILAEAEQILKKDFSVSHAPFGWYKAFTIKCKGHPLSELSREINISEKAEAVVSESLKEEEKVKSFWHILEPNGTLHELSIKDGKVVGFDFSKHENLGKFAQYEMAKSRIYSKEPPHISIMKKLELVDYESGSDPGNLRYYPKGRLIKSLLEQWVTGKAIEYGAMEIESPIMYDFEHPALKDYLNRFPARQYIVESAKKKFFLRFSACFGQFLMKSNMTISYKDLPLKMYELTRYSFRLEKAGELVGLKRLRAFTMPDMHTLCRDEKEARNEFKNQFKLSAKCMSDLGIDEYETAIRFTQDFWKENNEFVIELAKIKKKPVLIEMWSFRYAYFDPKFEFNFIDAADKASALATVQIDHENAKRYGITYVDTDGTKKQPTILHCSPSGGIERVMYALLEKTYMKDPKKSVLPLWLSPTQVRICPVNDSFIKDAEKLCESLEGIRIDIDDRTESIGKKIRDAEMEWVPLIIVLGEKEKKSKKYSVRFRESGKQEQMTLKQIQDFVKKQTEEFPFMPLSLPKHLSKRAVFVG